jgi:hypothetical protein
LVEIIVPASIQFWVGIALLNPDHFQKASSQKNWFG